MAQQITSGADGGEGLDKTRGRSRSERRYHTGHAGNRRPIMLDSLPELRHDGLSLAFEYAIDCALAMFQKAIRNKRGAMSSDEHKTLRQHALGELREIDDFRHIRQIVTGERHNIGPPVL